MYIMAKTLVADEAYLAPVILLLDDIFTVPVCAKHNPINASSDRGPGR